jgi:hypothetical protein
MKNTYSKQLMGAVGVATVAFGVLLLEAAAPCDNNIATEHQGVNCSTKPDGAECQSIVYTKPVGCTPKGSDPQKHCSLNSCGIVYKTVTRGYCAGGVCDMSLGSDPAVKMWTDPPHRTDCYPTKMTTDCPIGF